MTSIAGHIMHLHENLEITFSELKEVVALALDGKLEHVTEKVDGVNLMFSYDPVRGLRAARSKADITAFGVDREELISKFVNKGNASTAFEEGFNVLEKAIELIEEHDRLRIFGTKTNRWFSIEIVYTASSNTINYDCNHIVFHNTPVIELNHGLIARSANDELGKLLNFYIKKVQSSLQMKNWIVSGPMVVQLRSMTDGSLSNEFNSMLDGLIDQSGCSERNTLRDYIHGMALNDLKEFNLEPAVMRAVADRVAKMPGALNLVQIKKLVSVSQRDSLDEFVKSENELRTKWIKPIELAIQRMTIELLRGIRSSLIGNSDSEVLRIRKRMSRAIDAINASGNADAIAVLKTQMSKLGSIDNIVSPIEGIVFTYKGTTYKFTGSFAPVHKILSMFKFGPLMSIDIDAGIDS